jgi:hypothetical protein
VCGGTDDLMGGALATSVIDGCDGNSGPQLA